MEVVNSQVCDTNILTYNTPSQTTFVLPVLVQGTSFQELYSGGFLTSTWPGHCVITFSLTNSDGTAYTGTDVINANTGKITFD